MRMTLPASSTAKHTLADVHEMDVKEVASWMPAMRWVFVLPM